MQYQRLYKLYLGRPCLIINYFPKHHFDPRDILSSDAGIRPLFKSSKQNAASAMSRDHQLLQSPSGLWNMVGVKLTDHRRAAEEMMTRIWDELIVTNTAISKHCRTHQEPI